jgi:hypothetical protein
MRNEKARHCHAGLAHLRRRDVIALHALGRDVEQAAVEDVQPQGLGRTHFGRLSSLSGATDPGAQSDKQRQEAKNWLT